MNRLLKYAKYLLPLLVVGFCLSLGGVFATWTYANGVASDLSSTNGLTLNAWDFADYVLKYPTSGDVKIQGSVEGNTSDTPSALFNGSTSFSDSVTERWTNWSNSSEDRGKPTTWNLYFTDQIEFDEVRIHHFCDHNGCFIPKEVEITYANGALFSDATTKDATTDDQVEKTTSGSGRQQTTTTTTKKGYFLDGTFTMSDDSPTNVTFKTNWDNAMDLTSIATKSSRGWGGSSTETYNCFACDIDGTTVYYKSGTKDDVPYTSFYYSDDSSIKTKQVSIALTPQSDRFVGIVELEFYLDGAKIIF